MKVLGLISSLTDPASRARIIQYKDYFESNGNALSLKYFTPFKEENPPPWAYSLKKITGISEWRSFDFLKSVGRIPLLFAQSDFDCIWQNRLLQLTHSFWESKLKKPVAFDFDDAIWLNEGEKHVIKKIARSQIIFAGNEYLADYAAKNNKNVHVIPTTIDTTKLFPLKKETEIFTIGWIGTESNFHYLKMIEKPLLSFLTEHQNARFMIISSEFPGFLNNGNTQICFKKWEANKENEMINEFNVGVMPLFDSQWSRGKCSYKVLQYLACGIPAIASPVGMNKKLINETHAVISAANNKEWTEAFKILYNEIEKFKMFGMEGKELVDKEYSCNTWAPKITAHLKSIV